MKVLFLIATLVVCAQAYSYRIAADVKHPGVCIYNGQILLQGENRYPSKCQIVHCHEDGSIYIEGCESLQKAESINMVYPECCKDMLLEQGRVQKVDSILDSQVYNKKGFYPKSYYSKDDWNQGLYSQRYYPQGYEQGLKSQRNYPQGYKQGLKSQRYYPQGEYSQRFYPQGYEQGLYSQWYYPQGEYSQRYYPQGYYYGQEEYKRDEAKNQDYTSEYRHGYPLQSLNRRPNLLDFMYSLGVQV